MTRGERLVTLIDVSRRAIIAQRRRITWRRITSYPRERVTLKRSCECIMRRLPYRGSKAAGYIAFSYLLIDDPTRGLVLSKTHASERPLCV